MATISKSKLFLSPETEQKVHQLCAWIEQNCDKPIGFEELTRQSGFEVGDLMTLFGVYKKTSPMGYVRFCREAAKRKVQPNAGDLFARGLLKKPEDSD